MAIDIKEIYVTDLDAGNIAWWSQHKLDKINYNFGQLVNGGVQGPTGSQGPAGDGGTLGVAGTQGFQGEFGPQGSQGLTGTSLWVGNVDSSGEYKTILPFQDNPYGPNGIKVGDYVIDPGYTSPIPYLTGSAYNLKTTKTIYPRRHIDFYLDQSLIGYVDLLGDGTISYLKIGNENLDELELDFRAGVLNFYEDFFGQNSTLKITPSIVEFNRRTLFENNANISGVIYVPGAGPNKVLISTNTQGDVIWRERYEIFRPFPVGSIVRIPEFQFNEDNFHLDETLLQTGSPLPVLQNIYGRGKEGTIFQGWYLCHGETWKFGATSWQVPNLNSFAYTIDSNAGEQELVSNGNGSTQVLIGGAGVYMSAVYSSGDYDITSTIDTNIDTFATAPYTAYHVKRDIHIIYLRDSNLFWEASNNITPPSEFTLDLRYASTSNDVCLDTIPNSYILTPWASSVDWNTANMLGVTLWNIDIGGNKTTTAATGWYRANGSQISRYWTKTGTNTGNFSSLIFNCGSIVTANLSYDLSVLNLNGEASSLPDDGNYTISASNFELTTTLQLSGSNAASGWYRDRNTGVRRYWNGTSFRGSTFTLNYVELSFNSIYYSSYVGTNACFDNTDYVTFLESSTSLEFTFFSGVFDLYNTGSALYTNENYTSIDVSGNNALFRVRNSIGGSNLRSVWINNTVGSITSDSKIDVSTVQSCGGGDGVTLNPF